MSPQKKATFTLIAVLIVAIVATLFFKFGGAKDEKAGLAQESVTKVEEIIIKEIRNMKLKSSAFEHDQPIPEKYTCDADNINPHISISEVPAETKSLTLIVDDPDAPGAPPAGGWTHWTVWNINPDIGEIPEASVPAGSTEGITDFGKPGYGGPCPPSGTHRYQFKLYALDTLLDLDSSAKKEDIELAMEGHILGRGLLVGIYRRQ